MSRQMIDHLGNVFPTFTGMCAYYGMKINTVRRRLREGWSLKNALTESTRAHTHGKLQDVYDHLGNCYESERDMCNHYGINVGTYRYRVRVAQMSIDDALTSPVDNQYHGKQCVDHKGNVYPSLLVMCNHYGLDRMKYKQRITLGWSLEEALTQP